MNQKETLFWDRIQELAKDDRKISSRVYEINVASAKLAHVRDNVVTIILPFSFQESFWNTHLKNIIWAAGWEIFDCEMTAEYLFADDDMPNIVKTNPLNSSIPRERTIERPLVSNLDGKFNFDNFIPGEGNKFVKSACLIVADDPGTIYNPLFIHGGSGLGKTHLLNAIGNKILKDNPQAKILYITTENFVNEFVNATSRHKMQDFKDKFRNLDVLLIDDIQFLANKGSTQEEFFNTFDALQKANKQIVLTSDCAPRNLKQLPERLVSRFSYSLVLDLTPPDFETRMAILQNKIEPGSFTFEHDAIEYLANQISSNVRELEGALQTVTALALIEKIPVITVDLVARAIRSRTNQITYTVAIESIQEVVAEFYGVTVKDLKSTKRPQNLAMARHIAIYLSRELTDNSTTKIGKKFGGRDHSTVLNSYKKIKNMVDYDDGLRIELDNLKKKLR